MPPGGPPPFAPTTPSERDLATARGATPRLDGWDSWWSHNGDDILRLKEAIFARRLGSFPLGVPAGDPRRVYNVETLYTVSLLKRVVIPALLWAMDPANRQAPETEAAACLALAKVTDAPSHIALLEAAIQDAAGRRNSSVDPCVGEAAALSLGLLRRGDAGRRFEPLELDRVRDFLFDVYGNGSVQMRTRCCAMLSLGLLGDQPTQLPRTPASPTPTRRIFDLLGGRYADEQMVVVALLALSLQDASTVTQDMIDVLKECTLERRLGGEPVSDLVASYAALALGRIGAAKDAPALITAVRARRTGLDVRRSAAISLGRLGQRVEGGERAHLAAELWNAIEAVQETSTRNFGILSLAYMLEADIQQERTDLLQARGVKVAEQLLKIAEDGKSGERAYGALGLGLIGRAIGDRPFVVGYRRLREQVLEVLRKGLGDARLDERSQAAFALALGMVQDEGSRKALVGLLVDRREDEGLRGYAAVALGMIGVPSGDVVKALKEAMKEHPSEELRRQTAIAFCLLGATDAVRALLDELKTAESRNVQGQIVIALAKIGDGRAVHPLVDLLRDGTEPDLTRALACAGLGLIGDLEFFPSLSRLSKDINYRAMPEVLREVLKHP